MSEVTDALEFLSQSENRAEVLKLLHDGEQRDRYVIEEHLDDAEIVVATQGSPYALLDRTLAIRREADKIREGADQMDIAPGKASEKWHTVKQKIREAQEDRTGELQLP